MFSCEISEIFLNTFSQRLSPVAAFNRLMGPAKANTQKFQWVHLLPKNLLEKLFSERVSGQLPLSPPPS